VLLLSGIKRVPVGQLEEADWEEVAGFVYWSRDQCRAKWLCNLNNKDLPWSAYEDDLLTRLVKQEKAEKGPDFRWAALADQFNAQS
jgi:hypothetical protein